MFESVNSKYNALKAEEANNRFIVESVTGSEAVPFVDDEDEAVVDSDSVDDAVVAEVDKLLDKMVNKDDFDDDEIEDLLDDDDEDELDGMIDAAEVNID